MEPRKIFVLAVALVLVSGLYAWADFVEDFSGRPEAPFSFNNEFIWDDPEVGLATQNSVPPRERQEELKLIVFPASDPGCCVLPEFWDPTVAGSYEVTCQVVRHTEGLGAGHLDFKLVGDPPNDFSWTITWLEFGVALDLQFEQVETPAQADAWTFEIDTTDDFHCYRVDWDPNVPSAKLFVDDEFTGIEMREDSAPPTGEPAPPREGAPNSCSATLTAGLPVVKSYTTPTASQR